MVSSNIGGYPHLNGLDINALLGAYRFYDAGYSGTRVIAANIEAQHIWNGHETLSQVQTEITGMGGIGGVDAHATMVGQAMGGRLSGNHPGNHYERGISDGATLWSGSIATALYSGGVFEFTDASAASTYVPILKTGLGGATADVFNSSWITDDNNGSSPVVMGVDGLLYQTGKVGVAAVGNGGQIANTVRGIAAGYNAIAVAALGSDTDPVPYHMPSIFSGRGPNDYYDPVGFDPIVPQARARVDLAAPGQDLTLATTNPPGSTSNDWYNTHQAGTSFAAPLVAGGVALVMDAGKDLYARDAEAIDGRVIRAVLLNGADKTAEWNNGQQNMGGTLITSQSLDYATGAGRMNLDRTFDQYVDTAAGGQAGTTNVSGLDCQSSGPCDLGNVAATGWDYGWSNESSENLYFIEDYQAEGKLFTATLDWFADIDPGSETDFSGASFRHLANLDLAIFRYDPATRAILQDVALSISIYNLVEHLSFLLPASGYYGLRVANSSDLWNLTGATGENYGLAWSSVPEPATWLLAGPALPWIVRRSRRHGKV